MMKDSLAIFLRLNPSCIPATDTCTNGICIKKYGGGMIYDWGVHLIDQILFMMPDAKIKSVYADIKNVLHEEVDDYFKIILKMDNGVTAHIELSTYILKYQPRWLAAGDKGTMIVEDFGCNGSIYRTGKLLEKLPPQITETEAGQPDSLHLFHQEAS